MKPAAAFAVGLWTGAVVAAAIGAFYLRIWETGRSPASPQSRENLETRVQLLQKEQVRAQAEEARLKQTIAELQKDLESLAARDARRQERQSRREPLAGQFSADSWIADAVTRPDAQTLPRLEQAALQNNLLALDALALLAARDNAEALTRVSISGSLNEAGRQHAVLLLAATIEVNPRAEDLLQTIFAGPSPDPKLCAAALAGILTPDFTTPLRLSAEAVTERIRPDNTQRLWVVESWRNLVTDPLLLAEIDRVRAKLGQRATGAGNEPPLP